MMQVYCTNSKEVWVGVKHEWHFLDYHSVLIVHAIKVKRVLFEPVHCVFMVFSQAAAKYEH